MRCDYFWIKKKKITYKIQTRDSLQKAAASYIIIIWHVEHVTSNRVVWTREHERVKKHTAFGGWFVSLCTPMRAAQTALNRVTVKSTEWKMTSRNHIRLSSVTNFREKSFPAPFHPTHRTPSFSHISSRRYATSYIRLYDETIIYSDKFRSELFSTPYHDRKSALIH